MREEFSRENGITPTVNTFFSGYTVSDIIETVTTEKVNAISEWMQEKNLRTKNILVIGSYLTGAGLANRLVKESFVTVLDIYPHLRNLLDPSVSFSTSINELTDAEWDLVIDTTGIGGIDPEDILKINRPRVFLVEDPSSDGSDEAILNANKSRKLLKAVNAPNSALLYTEGLNSKTSGTMTLTMKILSNSMREALLEDGVLYSTASLEFYERILFKEKKAEKFLSNLKKNALIVSSLSNINCDDIIRKNLLKLKSRVLDYRGDFD